MLLLILLFIIVLLIIFNVIMLVNTKELNEGKSESCKVQSIKFSILIPFKDEEKNLLRSVISLNNLNYPKDGFEIIFINDSSIDNSVKIIENKLESKINYKIINAGRKKLQFKKGALDLGLSTASYNFILTTDADTEIPSDILHSYAEKFMQNFDIVFGPTHLINNNTFAGKLSQFYNLRSQLMIFSAANLGFPYSAMGSSLTYNKQKFEKLGGYKKFNEVISGDDDLLIREGVKNNLKIGFIFSSKDLMKSEAVTTLKKFLNQKARHTATSNYYLMKHQAALSIWHFTNLITLLILPFSILNPVLSIPFAIKILFDFILIKSKSKIFGYSFNFIQIFTYQITYEVLLIVNYINGSLKRYSWK